MRTGSAKQQTCLDACMVVQDVERECAAACASLAMPMPVNVSLRAEDLAQLQQRLLALLMQPDPAVPFTPSLKVIFTPLARQFRESDWLSQPNPLVPFTPFTPSLMVFLKTPFSGHLGQLAGTLRQPAQPLLYETPLACLSWLDLG